METIVKNLNYTHAYIDNIEHVFKNLNDLLDIEEKIENKEWSEDLDKLSERLHDSEEAQITFVVEGTMDMENTLKGNLKNLKFKNMFYNGSFSLEIWNEEGKSIYFEEDNHGNEDNVDLIRYVLNGEAKKEIKDIKDSLEEYLVSIYI